MQESTAKVESPRQSLTADDWAQAALEAMVAGGLEAVAVEPLARRLGVTKGSFYWHFPSREALVRAALALWERQETDDILAQIGDISDPYERVVTVFKRTSSSYESGRLYLAMAAASEVPGVGAVVRRVSERRLTYIYEAYCALGLSEQDAQLWATFAYATFIGNQQVHRDSPDRFPSGARFNEYFKLMIRTLIPHPQGGAPQHPHVVKLPGKS